MSPIAFNSQSEILLDLQDVQVQVKCQVSVVCFTLQLNELCLLLIQVRIEDSVNLSLSSKLSRQLLDVIKFIMRSLLYFESLKFAKDYANGCLQVLVLLENNVLVISEDFVKACACHCVMMKCNDALLLNLHLVINTPSIQGFALEEESLQSQESQQFIMKSDILHHDSDIILEVWSTGIESCPVIQGMRIRISSINIVNQR